MPENLRALIFLLFLSVPVFAFGKHVACSLAITEEDYARRRNLWFGITLAAFLAHNFWIFIIIASVLILLGTQRETNWLALYFFLFFAVPMIDKRITVLGVFLFNIDYVRLLSLTILLPALIAHNRDSLPTGDSVPTAKFGYHLQDKILLVYLMLLFLLHFQTDYIIEFLRHNIFYAFTDVFLPYYIASRTLNSLRDFRDALMSLAVACMALAAVASLECLRHWYLYASLKRALGAPWGYLSYLERGGLLRAVGTPGQAIALGFVLAVAVGIFLYFRKSTVPPMIWRLGMALLIAGLVAALSRGPWIGALTMVVIFVLTGPQGIGGLVKLGILVLVAVPLVSMTPVWDRIVDFLPFVGTIDSRNIDFRQTMMVDLSNTILENPLFGPREYNLEQFRTGSGIIDIVNTYLNIGLDSGLTGIALFSSFFLTTCVGIYKGMRRSLDKDDEIYDLGRTLLAVLGGILLIIGTVSSVTVIPYIYWSIAGVGVAYIRMVERPIIAQ